MRTLTYILARFYEARALRALRRYLTLKTQAQKFFSRLDRRSE
jgi:hypothetical protein